MTQSISTSQNFLEHRFSLITKGTLSNLTAFSLLDFLGICGKNWSTPFVENGHCEGEKEAQHIEMMSTGKCSQTLDIAVLLKGTSCPAPLLSFAHFLLVVSCPSILHGAWPLTYYSLRCPFRSKHSVKSQGKLVSRKHSVQRLES